jgi:hypothetical protein
LAGCVAGSGISWSQNRRSLSADEVHRPGNRGFVLSQSKLIGVLVALFHPLSEVIRRGSPASRSARFTFRLTTDLCGGWGESVPHHCDYGSQPRQYQD